jgi:biotin operon repressor
VRAFTETQSKSAVKKNAALRARHGVFIVTSVLSETVTRAAVKADLVQLEQSGYNVEGDHTTYPAQAQAAEQSGNKSRRDGDIVRTDREWFVRSRNAITRRSARRRAVDLFRAIT